MCLFIYCVQNFLHDQKIHSALTKYFNLDLFMYAVRNFFGYKNSYLPHSEDWKKFDEKTKKMLEETYEVLCGKQSENQK